MNRRGVTLIELVVGITISTAILSAAYAALATALDRREAAVAGVRADVEAQAIRSSLRAWLAGARIPPGGGGTAFSGADAEFGGLADDRLTFLTTASTPLGSGSVLVTLSIDRDPNTSAQGLVADLAAWRGTDRSRVELVPEAESLAVRYRSDVLSGRRWHPSWISASVMPAGVEVTIGGAYVPALLALPMITPLVGGR